MKPKLVIWGAGGHAMVVADIVRLRDEYEIVAFIDDVNPSRQGTMFCGAPVLGREQLDAFRQEGVRHMILGFGDCDARLELTDLVVAKGFTLAKAIHPGASVASDVLVGPGTVVKALAVVEPGAVLGQNVIIGAQAYVGHECIVEDGVHMSGGARLGGKSSVGRGAWIGLGATVKDRIRIGERAQIGAGSVVLQDIPDLVVAFGVPARELWSRDVWTTDQSGHSDESDS